jgi:HAMP domain-containing protein
MKYWQKTYLATLLLFLAALNIGAYLLFHSSYQSALSAERERSFSEQGFLSERLERDIAAILSRGEEQGTDVWNGLFRSYAEYYATQGVYIAILDNGGIRFSNAPGNPEAENIPTDSSLYSRTAVERGAPYLYTGGKIGNTGLALVTARSIAAMQMRMDDLARMLVLGTVLLSATLSVALFFTLKKLTHPIGKLSIAASALAGGDYSVRAAVKGKGEISELALRFNAMADEIQVKIFELTQEAEKKQRFIDDLAHEMRTPLMG